MNTLKKVTLFCVPYFLVACTSISPTGSKSGNKQTPDVKDLISLPKEKTDATETVKEAPVDKAVQANIVVHSLLDRADQQLKGGDQQGAEGSLERAIRIAPRYPESYFRLAELRYQQGKYVQASSLADKSLSLGADEVLSKQVNALLQNISTK